MSRTHRTFSTLAVLLAVVVGTLAAHLVQTVPGTLPEGLTPERQARLARKASDAARKKPFSEPDGAVEFYVNSRTGPIITRGANPTTGARTLDPARYLPAIEQMRDMPRYDSGTNTVLPPHGSSNPVENDLLGTWTALGPANQGGRTRGLLIDPANPNVMYAGGVAGGVWKSTDAGASWTPLTDLMANIAVSTLAFDPQNASIIYAGTGEGFYNGDAIRGAGIFRSTNAGLTWTQIASTNNANFHYTNRVIVSPRNSQRIFAATRTGLYRSIDGGGSWTSLSVTVNNGCTDMAIQAQGTSGYVFASCGTFAQATIYRVQDDDTAVPQGVFSPAGMGRSAIAVAPSNEAVVYVLGSQVTSGGGPGVHGLHGVYRSTVNGDPGSFTTQRQGNIAPVTTADRISQLLLTNPVYGLLADCGFGTTQFLNQGWYDNVIAVDPVDPLRVWAGGIDLWRSDNGGVDWGTAGYWWFGKGEAQYHHADQHGIVFHPQYNGTSNTVMFATSDGGVDRIDDARAAVNTTITQLCGTPVAGGATWVDRNAGYVTTQFYHGAPYPNGQTFFGGLQDNGTQRGTTGGLDWNTLLGGDGGYVAVDTLGNGNSADDVLFAEYTNLTLQRSTNGGVTFSDAVSGITESSNGFLFIAPFTMNPAVKQQLWIGGFYIWRTTNQASTWTRASAIMAGNGSVSAIAAHPLDGNRVLAAMSDGYLHYTTTGLTNTSATTWPNTRPTTEFVSSVAWDPNDLNVAYATVSSFTASTVFKTVNGGTSWAASMGSGVTALPPIPALSVVVNPASSQQVFVGTDLGVFVSIDGGASWMLENAGFVNTPVEALQFNETAPRRLFAFTHGRGAWSVNTGCAAVTITTATLADGTVGSAYAQTVLASGGTAPYTFVVDSGPLPPGLTLSSGGSLSGTPATAGTFDFTVRAGDVNTCPGTRAYTVVISPGTCPAITLSPGTLPGGTLFASYNQTLTATGGAGPYTFTVTSGTLPTGVTLATGGSLAGTPTATGTFTFTVTATASTGGCTGAQAYTITVGPAASTTIVTFEAGPYVYRGTAFTATATVTGAGGLNQAAAVSYSGNCTNVTSADGCMASASFAGSATHQASNGSSRITITPATATTTAIDATAPAASATVDLGATVTSTAAVNEGTVTFTVRQGATPIGTPAPSGTVAGGAATASFSIPAGTPGGTYTIDASYTAGPNFVAGSTAAGTLTLTGGCPVITVSPGTLPGGTIFGPYSEMVTASGGTGTHTFAVTAGTLPTGVTLATGGSLAGTPTATGTFSFTVTATAATGGCTGAQAYTITVGPAASTTIVTFEAGPYVYRGTPFTATATVTGPGRLDEAVPVSYSGDCTNPTTTNGCTASASFAGTAVYLASGDTRAITILQPTDPQPAAGLRVDAVDGTLVRFRWTAPQFGPAPESYILEGGVNPGDVLATLPTGSSSPVLDVVVPPGSWHARLRTVAGAAQSGNSNEVAVIVALPVVPSAPVDLTGVVDGSALGLSWKNTFEGGPPAGMVLEVSGSATTSIPLGVGESFAFSGVPAGTYTLQVRAANAGGSSPVSNAVTLTFPGACSGAPEAPIDVLAYRVGSVVTVIWDPPATGSAPTSYLLNVTGSFVGTFSLTDRAITAPVGPGSYTISLASANACGSSAAAPSQTVVVP